MIINIRYESVQSQKPCAACRYWNGQRKFSPGFVNGHPLFIQASERGKCDVNYDKEWPSAAHCSKWQKWEKL